MIRLLAIGAAAAAGYKLGQDRGHRQLGPAIARETCEVAHQAFRAGFRACRIASEDLGVDAFIAGQRENAGMQ